MDSSVADSFTAFAMAVMAALGGAFMVYADYDDAPGGILIGLLLVIGAGVLCWKALQRRGRVAVASEG